MLNSYIKKHHFLFILFWIFYSNICDAQQITRIETRWSDSFSEWIIYTTDDEIMGLLSLRNTIKGDWSSWVYQVGDHYGTIKLKWPNNPDQWELRGGGEIITARTLWRNDQTEWSCFDGDTRIKWKATSKNIRGEWLIHSIATDLYFSIYTTWEGDPKDWIIEEDDTSTLSFPYKMMLIFTAIHHSSPKE